MKFRVILLVVLFHAIGFSAQYYCARELQPILEKVQALPEAAEVIDQVLERGPISIELNHDYPDDFFGYWRSDQRTIYISKTSSECIQITALIMELHNALRNADIEQMHALAYNRSIDREQFIEQFEYLEYENACETRRLVELGAHQGLFPCNCRFNIADNFGDHLDIQYKEGHSDWIGQIYDELSL